MASIKDAALNIERIANGTSIPEARERVVAEALVDLNQRRRELSLHDRRLLIHANRGYHLSDGMTMDEVIYPYRVFGELVLSGLVPNLLGTRFSGRYEVVLGVQGPKVHGPATELEQELLELELDDGEPVPLDTPLPRPIYIPVSEVVFVANAA